jgi:RNA polymerase sigma-70 factor (ECF subfamily)
VKQTDEELVELAKAGDQGACTELYSRYFTYARANVARILRTCPEEIEDVVQTAMAKSFLALDGFSGNCKFKTWLHRIAVNCALGVLRQRKCSAIAQADPLENDEYGDVIQFQIPDEERGYREFEVASDLPKILSRMSPIYRDALIIRFIYEARSVDAKDELGISEGTYKSRIGRALNQAREIMDELNLPVTKRQCWKCEKEKRFRFADKLEDGQPVCKWCARPAETPTRAISAQPQTWNKVCRCCGEPFIAIAAATQYAPGHKDKMKAKRKSEAAPTRPYHRRVASFPEQPRPVVEAQIEKAQPAAEPEESVLVRVPVKYIDQMWAALTPADKGRVFEFLFKEPA